VRLVTPGNRNWRIAVGSKAEMMLLSVLLALTVALYPLSHIGFRDALQAVARSFDIAVEQYQRQIGTHWYDLDLVASDNLTLARVTCRCPVVGLWKGGLVVLQDGQPRAVGKSQQNHNLLPITGRLIEGEPLTGAIGAGRNEGPNAALAVEQDRPAAGVLHQRRGADRED
jgi:inner membrane protein